MLRRSSLALLVLALGGCEPPLVVECGSSGRLVTAGGDHWCIYARTSSVRAG